MQDVKIKILRNFDEKANLDLAKMMIETPSVTGDETDLARRLAEFMKDRGFDVDLQEVADGKYQTIGRVKGEGGGKTMMLCGHLDIFPPPADMKDPYRAVVQGNKLFGAGIADMKAGTTAMVLAADAVLHADAPIKGDIVVAAVMEEEIGGVGIKHLLNKGVKADMGIVPESTNLEISTTGAGIAQFTVSTLGKSVHISGKENGVDAVAKMAKAIDAINGLEFTYVKDPRVPKLPRLVASTVIGGRGRNYDLRGAQNLSDFCTLLVDVRFWKSQTVKGIERDLRRTLDRVAASDPEFRYELHGVPSPFGNRAINRNPKDVPLDSEIIRIVKENHLIVKGEQAKIRDVSETAGNDDGVHMNEQGIKTITYGPGQGVEDASYGKAALQTRYIDVDTMHINGKVMALSSYDVCSMIK